MENKRRLQQTTIDTCSSWRWLTLLLPPGIWQNVVLLLQVYWCRRRQFVDVFCSLDSVMAAFDLDVMPVNAAFQNALLNDIVDKHPELWSRVRFRIMDDPICYELRVIWKATGASVKYYARSRSLPSKHPWSYLSAGICTPTGCKDCSRLLF